MGPRVIFSEAIRALEQSFGSPLYLPHTQSIAALGINCLHELNEKDWASWQGWSEEKKASYRTLSLEMIFSATLVLALAHQQDREEAEKPLVYPVLLANLYELVPDLYAQHDSRCQGELVDCGHCNLKVLWALGKNIRSHREDDKPLFHANVLRKIFSQDIVMIKQIYALQAKIDSRAYQAQQDPYQVFLEANTALLALVEAIQEQGQKLEEQGLGSAAKVALTLKESIELAFYHYFQDRYKPRSLRQFKKSIESSLEKAMPELLQQEESWNKLLSDLASFVQGNTNPYADDLKLKVRELMPEEADALFTSLETIELKGQELKARGFDAAAEAAEQLKEDVEQALYDYLEEGKQTPGNERFKLSCEFAIARAEKVLGEHRGWGHLLANLALALAGVVFIYLAATIVNKALTGNFTFFAETDAVTKLAPLKLALEEKSQPDKVPSSLVDSKSSASHDLQRPSKGGLTPEMRAPTFLGGSRLRGSNTYSPKVDSDQGVTPGSAVIKSKQ